MKGKILKKLSRLQGFEEPRISLEQYVTPPQLAADMIHSAYMNQDIEGRKVLDLGTGTGIFAAGAALAGAKNVVAVDVDQAALKIAEENLSELGLNDFVEIREEDYRDVEESFDTVLMNPPFSVHSDVGIGFFRKAVELADAVYAVSHRGAREGIKDFVASSEHEIEALEEYNVALPNTYGFHTEEDRETKMDVIITRQK